jgi:hypothetical protein
MRSTAAGALRLAAARGDIYTMELLSRAQDFDINADMTGFTPLMAAVVQGQELAVLWLLQHGASLGSRKEDGWNDSVLHYAAAKGGQPIVQALLAFGADATATNAHNRSPAEVALVNGHRAVSEYITAVASGHIAAPDKAALIASRRFAAWHMHPVAATSNVKVDMGHSDASLPDDGLDEHEVRGSGRHLCWGVPLQGVPCCCRCCRPATFAAQLLWGTPVACCRTGATDQLSTSLLSRPRACCHHTYV